MSEPIQSISQGNFILQGTVATSAGIVGDGTPQNPLRSDETVLFNPSTPVVFGTDMTLSEPYSAFERIGIYNGHDCYGSFDSFRLSGDQDARIFTYYYPTNTASPVEFGVLRFSAVDANTLVACTNTNVQISTAGAITRQTNINNYSMRTAKIVGINRIQ